MDSIGTIVACTQATIRELELGELPEKTIRGTIGLGLRETIEILSPGCDEAALRPHPGGLPEALALDLPRHAAALRRGRRRCCGTSPAEGYLLAVATGKSRRGLDYALDQTGLRELFHATRTVDEAFSKPHPQMLLDILDELGVRRARR